MGGTKLLLCVLLSVLLRPSRAFSSGLLRPNRAFSLRLARPSTARALSLSRARARVREDRERHPRTLFHAQGVSVLDSPSLFITPALFLTVRYLIILLLAQMAAGSGQAFLSRSAYYKGRDRTNFTQVYRPCICQNTCQNTGLNPKLHFFLTGRRPLYRHLYVF
jgi:hypothetical protein